LGTIAKDIPDDSGLDVPTTADLIVFAFNSDPDPSIHLSTEEVQFLYQNPAIVEELESCLFTESQEAKEFGKWVISYLTAHPNLDFEIFKKQFLGTPEGPDGDFDANFWDDQNNTFPPQNLLMWADFESAFLSRLDVRYETSSKLFISIGRDLLKKLGAKDGINTCAVRLSKALNYSGVTIPHIPGKTFQGNDGKYYFTMAIDINRWMRKTFGCANPNTARGEYLNINSIHYNSSQIAPLGANLPDKLGGLKGIYSMVSRSTTWGTGHADIFFTNATCDPGGDCHFNAPIQYIDYWILQ